MKNDAPARLWRPRHWPSWLGAALLFLVGRLPLPVLVLAGDGIGMLLYVLHRSRRRVALRNLTACFPQWSESARRRLARRHFRALGRSLVDTGLLWWASRARMHRVVHITGREHYDALIATGQPIILLAPHFVGIQAGVALTLERPIVNFYRPVSDPVMRRLYARQMARFGGQLVARQEGIRPALRALKQRSPFYYLPDQDFGRAYAVFAAFFGVPAATTTALARLAGATGAAVLPCVVRQRRMGGYEIIFRAPLTGYPSGDERRDARRMNEEIEREVRLMPEQYFWVHKRFKTRPSPGDPDFYA